MRKLPSLTIFFPCLNEEGNVEAAIVAALRTTPEIADEFEVIIVDDGSTDLTKQKAEAMGAKHPEVRVVSHSENKGYGAALKTGFREAKSEWIFFTDGDLQFNLEELTEFIPHAQDYDVIIGYRTNRAEGAKRALNAYLFKLFIDALFRVHVRDIDCAFKLLKADVIKPLHLESDGAFTSAEMLYRLKKQDIHFKQIPVTHLPRQWGNPTGADLKVIIKAGYEALRLYSKVKLQMMFGKN